MSPSTASDVPIDIDAASAEPNHPLLYERVFSLLLAAAAALGDMIVPPALTVTGFFIEVSHYLLAAAEKLDDDVNNAIPHAPIVFILGSLIGFAGVKAQGDPDFPFNSHNTLIKCSITSLLFFGIASATQVFAPPAYKAQDVKLSRQMSPVCECSRMDHFCS